MTGPLLVFVNDRTLELGPGSRVADAIAALGPPAPEQLAAGRGHVTDARGIRVEPTQPLYAGAILRFVVSARRGPDETDADA